VEKGWQLARRPPTCRQTCKASRRKAAREAQRISPQRGPVGEVSLRTAADYGKWGGWAQEGAKQVGKEHGGGVRVAVEGSCMFLPVC
jgi:hypothetical protein